MPHEYIFTNGQLDHGSLIATRLSALCLKRNGRPRGLIYDDYLVRAGLVVDLVLLGALSQRDDAIILNSAASKDLNLVWIARLITHDDRPLDEWFERGALKFSDWAGHLVKQEVWHRKRSIFGDRFADGDLVATERDRQEGRKAALRKAPGAGPPPTVLALGLISGLFGDPKPAPEWSLTEMGEHRWAGDLAVNWLTEAARTFRLNWGTVVILGHL